MTGDSAAGELRAVVGALAGSEVELLVAPAIVDVAGPRTVLRRAGGLQLLHVEEPTFAGPQRVAKEVLDRVSAAVALVVLAPVFVVVAVAVRLDSPGPVLFRQTRVGRRGRRFAMVKFRTMVEDAERLLRAGAPQRGRRPAVQGAERPPGDAGRAAPAALLARRAAPAAQRGWGDMSLVGPAAAAARRRSTSTRATSIGGCCVKPGITGLWQVSGRSDLSWEEAIRLDLYYVDHWSPTMDLAIVVRTLSAVVRGSGAY